MSYRIWTEESGLGEWGALIVTGIVAAPKAGAKIEVFLVDPGAEPLLWAQRISIPALLPSKEVPESDLQDYGRELGMAQFRHRVSKGFTVSVGSYRETPDTDRILLRMGFSETLRPVLMEIMRLTLDDVLRDSIRKKVGHYQPLHVEMIES